jgi:hypothetical protein
VPAVQDYAAPPEPPAFPPPAVVEVAPVPSLHESDLEWEAEARRRSRRMLLGTLGGVGLLTVLLVMFFVLRQDSTPDKAGSTKVVKRDQPPPPAPILPPPPPKDDTAAKPKPPEKDRPPDRGWGLAPVPDPGQRRQRRGAPDSGDKGKNRGGRDTPLKDDKDKPARKEVKEDEESLKLLRTLNDHRASAARRAQAAKLLGETPPHGRDVIRGLCEALLDSHLSVRVAASEALDKLSPEIHALVIPLLADQDVNEHSKAVQKLMRLGQDANPATPVLLHYRRRLGGGPVLIQALAAIAPGEEKVATLFARWLTTEADDATRSTIALVMAKMDDGRDHIKTLCIVAKADNSPAVRSAAVYSLGELGQDSADALKTVRLLKNDSSADVRSAAEKALEKILPDR